MEVSAMVLIKSKLATVHISDGVDLTYDLDHICGHSNNLLLRHGRRRYKHAAIARVARLG